MVRLVHYVPLAASLAAAQDSSFDILQYVFSGFRSKSSVTTQATLSELGIGDHAWDNSKILNITDLNWAEYLGPQNPGEWLVEFTAKPEHCASCELVDLAFNVSCRSYSKLTDQDASHKVAAIFPELNMGRVDCSEEIILSTRFLVTKPPILYHVTPSTRTLRRLPPEVGRPAEILEYYYEHRWQSVSPWGSVFNPLGEGAVSQLVEYAGIGIKTYTHLVDRIP